jgi:hypothetical protein
MPKYKPDDAARKRKYEAAMRAKREHEKVHGPYRRPIGRQDQATVLSRSVLHIVVGVLRGWLDGDPVTVRNLSSEIEGMLRDALSRREARLLNGLRHSGEVEGV